MICDITLLPHFSILNATYLSLNSINSTITDVSSVLVIYHFVCYKKHASQVSYYNVQVFE